MSDKGMADFEGGIPGIPGGGAPLDLPPEEIARRLLLAILAGAVVAVIYRLTRRPGADGIPLVGTLVMLTGLIALVTMVIGTSTARAFSLVGALSIVRFRTVVDDARDTAFVIFGVGMGMAIGVDYKIGAAIGLPVIGAAAALLALWERRASVKCARYGVLNLRLSLGCEPEKVLETVGRQIETPKLTTASTAKQGAALDLTYSFRWRGEPTVVSLINTLGKCDGVQGVEIK